VESVAVVPATAVDAPSNLGARFSSVLSKLDGRTVGADALFETLMLETLDWGIDQGVEIELLDAEQKPVTAGGDR
jgi:hypothetical protein